MSDETVTGGYATQARVERLERRVADLEHLLGQMVTTLDQLARLVVPD
jgi:hypothetical protein